MAGGPIQIISVASKAELARFIRVPLRLGASDPNYVPPLMFERGESLTAKGNPFFDHADVQFWLAVRDGRDVGRISAQIDHLNPQLLSYLFLSASVNAQTVIVQLRQPPPNQLKIDGPFLIPCHNYTYIMC